MTTALTMLALAGLVVAFESESVQIGSAQIEIKVDRTTVAVTETVSIRVVATAPENVELERPTFQTDPEQVVGTSTKPFGPDTIDSRRIWIWEIEVDPLEPGRLNLPPLVIRVREGDELLESMVPLPAIEVTGESSIQGNSDELREVPPAPNSGRGGMARALRWAGVVVLIALGVFAIFSLRTPPKRTAREDAILELAALEKTGTLSYRTRAEAACTVLRQYIEFRHCVPTSRLTTVEFLRDPRTTGSMSEASRERLARILPLADVERFGAEGPTPKQWEQLLAMIRDYFEVDETP